MTSGSSQPRHSILVHAEHPALATAFVQSLDHLKHVVRVVFSTEKVKLDTLNIVIVDDRTILDINREYLDHDYYTDIITFPYCNDPVEADLYISLDTVRSNAEKYAVSADDELHRVVIHGCLHLCDYDDTTDELRMRMRERENFYLNLLQDDNIFSGL